MIFKFFKTLFLCLFFLVNFYDLFAQQNSDKENTIKILEHYSSASPSEQRDMDSKLKREAQVYLPNLIEIALTHPDENLRENAKRMIVSWEEASQGAVRPLFLKAMNEENSDVRERARDILGAMGKEAEPILEDLKRAIENPDDHRQQRAFRILSALLWETHFDAYPTASKERTWFERMRQEAEAIIRKGLKSSNENIKNESMYALHENPHMVSQVLPELVGVLKDTSDTQFPYNDKAAVAILQSRDHLTDAEEITLAELLTSTEMEHNKNPKEICSHLCHYASNYLNELQDKTSFSFHKEDHTLKKPNPDPDDMGSPLVSLPSLFVIKAAQFCPQLKEQVDPLVKNFWNESSTEISQSCQPGPDLFNNLRRFMGGVLQTIRLGFAESEDIYLHEKKFYILFLQELLNSNLLIPTQREKITQELMRASESLKATYEKTELRSSRFGTYSIATMLQAVKEDKALADLQKSRNPKQPLLFPYDPGDKIDPQLDQNPSSSIGRTVPAYLALYKYEQNNELKEEYLKNLKGAVEFYIKEWPFSYYRLWLDEASPRFIKTYRRTRFPVRAHSSKWPSDEEREALVETSPHMAPYGVAPYYIYPSLPYVSSALHLLTEKAKTEDEKREIKELKNTFHQQLSSLMGDEGIRVNEKDNYYKAYAQLTSFALLPLAEECAPSNNSSALYGILNFE